MAVDHRRLGPDAAIAVLAALIDAAEVVARDLASLRVVMPVVADAVASTARAHRLMRPGSGGSSASESQAAMHEAARRAVQRAVARRFAPPTEA